MGEPVLLLVPVGRLLDDPRRFGQNSGVDNLTEEQRRRTMRAVRAVDTGPEMRVRRLIFSMGYRYRLHVRRLPGCPDLLFPGRRKLIFIHGCFWHGHGCASGRKRPRTNSSYWDAKLLRNRMRDQENRRRLEALGWQVLVLWECEVRDVSGLRQAIVDFLESPGGETRVVGSRP